MSGVHVQVKRIYEEPSPSDGARVLVDRLWPRGISKERANLTLWAKDVAPSTELRKWYDHDPAKFDEFAQRYRRELQDAAHAGALAELRRLAASGPAGLVVGETRVEPGRGAVALVTRA